MNPKLQAPEDIIYVSVRHQAPLFDTSRHLVCHQWKDSMKICTKRHKLIIQSNDGTLCFEFQDYRLSRISTSDILVDIARISTRYCRYRKDIDKVLAISL